MEASRNRERGREDGGGGGGEGGEEERKYNIFAEIVCDLKGVLHTEVEAQRFIESFLKMEALS